MVTMTDWRKQAIAGLVPPETGEAMIRENWPSVAAHPGIAALGIKLSAVASMLARTVILLPIGIVIAFLAWALMAPVFFGKLLPGMARRYTLTNRRLMIRRGLTAKPSQEIALADIDEVRIVKDSNSEFFRAGNLEVISQGQVKLTLKGVPNPEAFRHAIDNTCKAWVPGRAGTSVIPAIDGKNI
jgi:hypothetical protein